MSAEDGGHRPPLQPFTSCLLPPGSWLPPLASCLLPLGRLPSTADSLLPQLLPRWRPYADNLRNLVVDGHVIHGLLVLGRGLGLVQYTPRLV